MIVDGLIERGFTKQLLNRCKGGLSRDFRDQQAEVYVLIDLESQSKVADYWTHIDEDGNEVATIDEQCSSSEIVGCRH